MIFSVRFYVSDISVSVIQWCHPMQEWIEIVNHCYEQYYLEVQKYEVAYSSGVDNCMCDESTSGPTKDE